LKVDTKASPITVTWQGKAPRYRVEVAAGPAFANPILSLESDTASAVLKDLQAGDYGIRVIALGTEGVDSLPSPVAPFSVERSAPWWLLLLLVPLF